MQHRVLLRADGDAQLGLGHVMRCLALAEMLGDGYALRFAVVGPTPTVRALIEERDVTVVPLVTSEVTEFLAVALPDEVAVLDGYHFDEAYQRAVRGRVRRLVYVDDLVQGHQVADVVINHAGSISQSDYQGEAYTQYQLGPHYALLRPVFFAASDPVPADGPIFINLGGADPRNYSASVLEAVRQLDPTLPVDLVLGAFHPDRPGLEAYRTHLPSLTIRQNLSAVQMRDALEASSLAITACSTIAYEVCALHRPLIGIVTADNQARLAQFLSDEKLALSVNFPYLLSRMKPVIPLESALRTAIQFYQFSDEAVEETLANQRRFFDGRSPERFRNLFAQLCA